MCGFPVETFQRFRSLALPAPGHAPPHLLLFPFTPEESAEYCVQGKPAGAEAEYNQRGQKERERVCAKEFVWVPPNVQDRITISKPKGDAHGKRDRKCRQPGSQTSYDKDAAEAFGGARNVGVDLRVGDPQVSEVCYGRRDILQLGQPDLEQLPEEVDSDQQ